MFWLLLFACVALILCIIFNAFSYLDWKNTAKTALRAYRDESAVKKYLHYILRALSVLCFIASIVLFATGIFVDLTQFLAGLSLSLISALFGFVPPSSAYWCITEKGIFFARKRLTITWEELVKFGNLNKGKQTQITLQIKKGRGEIFKTVYYAVLVATDKADEALQIIRDFLNARDRYQYMHKQKLEQKTELKNRKFY